jgi:hypothetical protein
LEARLCFIEYFLNSEMAEAGMAPAAAPERVQEHIQPFG